VIGTTAFRWFGWRSQGMQTAKPDLMKVLQIAHTPSRAGDTLRIALW
jgi:hypothetical protein